MGRPGPWAGSVNGWRGMLGSLVGPGNGWRGRPGPWIGGRGDYRNHSEQRNLKYTQNICNIVGF